MSLSSHPGDAAPPPPGASSDSVGGALGTLIHQQRSLTSGLLALADDAPSRALRRALRELARRIESGMPLGAALDRRDSHGGEGAEIPRSLAVAAEAGERSNRLLLVLSEYQLTSEELRRRRRSLWGALTYPLIVLTFGLLLAAFLMTWVVPQYRAIFADFGVSLPGITILLLSVSDFLAAYAWWGALGVLLLLAVGLVFLQRLSAPVARGFHWIPLLGGAFYWSGLSEFCRWLSLFVRARAPLETSLRSMAGLVRDPWLASCCGELAKRTERGESLSSAAEQLPGLPPQIRSVCRWAQQGEGFNDLLDSSARIFAEQSELQARMLRLVIVPVMFVGVVFLTLFVIFAAMLPMVRLLTSLV